MDKVKQKLPRVSVVMPTRNHGHLIPNAINSILNQTIKDWELIIVDDGSTDNTKEMVRPFLNDSRIRFYISAQNGLVAARNKGNELTRADVIALQDSDDLSLPDRLEKSLNAMKQTGADIVYHGIYTNMWDKQHNCIGREYVSAKPFNKYQLLE